MFKFSKRFFSLFLAFFMMSFIVIGSNAQELIADTNHLMVEIDIIEPLYEDELEPMMARGCGQWIGDIYYSNTFLGEPNSSYLDESGTYNKKYFFDSNGCANMVVHYSGHHGHPNPHSHTFSACYNERLGGLCWTESSAYTAWSE